MTHTRLILAFLLATPIFATPIAALAQSAPPAELASLTLPDAPLPTFSTAPEPEPQSGPAKLHPYTTVLVNGRPYHFPTPHEQFRTYERNLIGVGPIFHAAIRAGLEQIKPNPVGWGQDFPGYLQRFGSAYGEAAISNTVRYGMAAALHEDDRYLICHHCSVGAKFANAALAEVSARHGADGHRVFSPTPIAASLAGPLVAYNAWYPAGENNSSAALRHVVFNVSTRFAFNALREFLFDHDTPEEKAASQPPLRSTN